VAGHGQANAVLLPVTIGALRRRCGEPMAALEAALGEDPVEAAARLLALTGAELAITDGQLDACVEEAAARPQLDATPPRADRDELRSIYATALRRVSNGGH
jgi:alcohol dehydrogenase class IV